jgi:hypothetical protein
MKKKFFSLLLTVLLVAAVMTSTASAGGNVGLKSVQFSIGSLIANGTLTGLGGYKSGVTADLAARGIPTVLCTNQGGNQASGQNPSKIFANGKQYIGPQAITKKGTAFMDVEASPGSITALEGGCPNNNWSAKIVSVAWTNATISVYDTATGALLLERNYICDPTKQTATTAYCTEIH